MSQVKRLEILHYPHLALRHKSKPLKKVDAELRSLVREMFDLMYEAKGIGLAGNQVGLPYRLFVVNLESDPAATDQEMVFINPVISQPKGSETQEEGCLSMPGLYSKVTRPAKIHLHAYGLDGTEFKGELEGMASRVVQHETDHLDGVLFTDRLTETGKLAVKDALFQFEEEHASKLRTGEIPDEASLRSQLAELEQLRT